MVADEKRYLWKQMDGPQGNSIIRAVYQYLKEMVDPHLDYFNTLSIDTANDDHTVLIGTLMMGIARKNIADAGHYAKLFKYTLIEEYDRANGFAEEYTEEDNRGGFLDYTTTTLPDNISHQVPVEEYKYILKLMSKLGGGTRSIAIVDEIVRYFTPSHVKYEIGYHTTPGDLFVTFSNGVDLYRSYIMQMVLEQFFYTSPRVHLIISQTQSPIYYGEYKLYYDQSVDGLDFSLVNRQLEASGLHADDVYINPEGRAYLAVNQFVDSQMGVWPGPTSTPSNNSGNGVPTIEPTPEH